MTYQEAIDQVEEFIVANGVNAITADVLRPILLAMVQASEDTTGLLPDLETTDKSNLVAAINEVLASVVSPASNAIRLHQGASDPNVSPPASHNLADFYLRLDIDANPIQLYQYIATSGLWEAVSFGGGGSGGFSKTLQWDGTSTITVPSGFTGTVFNENQTNTASYTLAGTDLTITGGAFSGDFLQITQE